MKFEVFLERKAEQDLTKLPEKTFSRIIKTLQKLSQNPHPTGSRKISGSQHNDWRVRVGDYRVVYEVLRKEKEVRVMRIRHRKDAYR